MPELGTITQETIDETKGILSKGEIGRAHV